MANFHHDLLQLRNEVAELRVQLDQEREDRKKQWWRIVWKLRRFRAAIIRLERGWSGERWHVGREYTRGSWILIPGIPDKLTRWKTDRSPGSKHQGSPTANIDLLSDEDICSGRRNGIPKRVGPDAAASAVSTKRGQPGP